MPFSFKGIYKELHLVRGIAASFTMSKTTSDFTFTGGEFELVIRKNNKQASALILSATEDNGKATIAGNGNSVSFNFSSSDTGGVDVDEGFFTVRFKLASDDWVQIAYGPVYVTDNLSS